MLAYKVLLITAAVCLCSLAVNSAPVNTQANSKRTPTLMISFDGFRADYLNEFLSNNPNSYLQKLFVEVGVKAKYMNPSFPSLTFPNHFTLVTGLYMESHGITGNSFFDPNYNQSVNLLRDSNAMDIKYWNGSEPIWETAKRQGLKTASFFWTGSEVWGKNPDIFMAYNNRISFESRCDEIVNWFAKFELDFATLYFNEPDHTGHEYGPNSNEYKAQIAAVDKVLGYLMAKLEAQDLLNKLNILVVSDHGMAEMTNNIDIKKYTDIYALTDYKKSLYGIVSNIYPFKAANLEKLYNLLKQIDGLDVYYREEVPERLHYSKNDRIAPIVAVAREGYVMHSSGSLKGNHGFDNQVESMRAIFLARGPDFNTNTIIEPVNNVDVYPLLCRLIDMQCRPNNGTISNFQSALVSPPDAKYAARNNLNLRL